MNKKLLILGAGQYGRLAKEIAEAMNYFEKIDFLDDNAEIAIGKLNEYENFSVSYSYAIAASENPEIRLEWIHKLEESCFRVAILVHPKACVSPSAQIMKGTIVEALSVINTGSVIASGCIISAGAVVNYNTMCADGVHIDCNATVAANTLVPAGTHIQSNTFYKNNNIRTEDLFFNAESRSKNLEKNKSNKPHGPLTVNGLEYCFEDGM